MGKIRSPPQPGRGSTGEEKRKNRSLIPVATLQHVHIFFFCLSYSVVMDRKRICTSEHVCRYIFLTFDLEGCQQNRHVSRERKIRVMPVSQLDYTGSWSLDHWASLTGWGQPRKTAWNLMRKAIYWLFLLINLLNDFKVTYILTFFGVICTT